jgi:outer membrane lipopolysaccharide assembly protein LptE/RlpB
LTMRSWRTVAIGAAIGLTLVGCGYHLVGTSSSLPAELQTLYVEKFENLTSWIDMDQRMVEEVTLEWVRRRRFDLVDSADGADLVLSGVITNVSFAPVSFDEQGRANEYQITLLTSVKLRDVRGDEPKLLWEDRAFSRRTSYPVDPRAKNYFDRQIEAINEVSREYARALVSAVLEGF